MRKTLKLFFIAIILSCNNIAKESINNKALIIEDSVFINVLADIHIIEAVKHLNYIPNDSNSETTTNYYNLIFEHHNISLEEFLSTYNYNLSDPSKMEKILSSVIQKIELEEIDLFH